MVAKVAGEVARLCWDKIMRLVQRRRQRCMGGSKKAAVAYQAFMDTLLTSLQFIIFNRSLSLSGMSRQTSSVMSVTQSESQLSVGSTFR